MAIYRWAGCSDAFVTFTYNPQWLEIKRALLLEQQPQDRPDLVTRVFKIKLKELINDIHKKHILGRTIAGIYVVEFQKRVSASEATWRIFKFDMHEWFPTVERLQYHLPNQQMMLFCDGDDVQEVATRAAISKTMLT
jgi:hypothetical protein